jgi:branched-chain amino acid transport system substrate-binding protein
MNRQKSILFVLLAAIFLTIGCGKREKTDTEMPIKIGFAAPFTGPYAKQGNDMSNGAALAVEEWNQRGGLLGRRIQLVRRDDEGKPKQAISIARELVNEGVVAVLGHYNSGCTIPSSEIFSQHKIPIITPAATNPQVTDRGYKFVFRVCGRDDQQGAVGAEFAAEKLHLKRVAVLHDKTPYGQGLADEFKKNAEKLGLSVVYYGGVSADEMDFRAVISAMRAGNPELLYFGGIYNQAGPLLIQARNAGLDVKFMSGDAVIDREFLKTAGPYAEGVYLTFGPDPDKVPSAKAFLEKYRARFGEAGPYSVYAYDAANILFTAIQKAGTTDGDQIADVLHTETFEAAMGNIQFDPKGDITSSYYVIWIVKNGEFVVYE